MTEKNILHAAKAVFLRKGLDAATMRLFRDRRGEFGGISRLKKQIGKESGISGDTDLALLKSMARPPARAKTKTRRAVRRRPSVSEP